MVQFIDSDEEIIFDCQIIRDVVSMAQLLIMRPVIENAVELLWKSFSIQFNEIIQGNAGEGGALKNLKKGLSMRSDEKDSSFIAFL